MKDLRAIAVFVLLVGSIPFVTDSGVVLNFVMMALYACLLAQAWNVLGGFGGQFSFGHALFFGVGAYVHVMAQVHGGWNPWLALPVAMLASAGVGAFVGALSFRYGLKGSYFALVTLAFAEVFRILALSVPFTGAGVGLMLPLNESLSNMQFSSRAGYVWLVLSLVTLALLVTAWLRHSRFGAYLQAVREVAAQADWVLPGLDEGRLLTGHNTPEDIAQFYRAQGAKGVVVKLGAEGAYMHFDSASGYVPAHPVDKVIDTVGAGDAFAVGIISGLLENLKPQQAVQRATWMGARAVQVRGDSDGLPTRAELNAAQLQSVTA